MVFDFKPYFFGNRRKWCTLRKLTDVDPMFEKALNSGFVCIDIPVTFGMELAFFHYMQTGEIYNGNGMPLIGDPLYQAIALEIKDSESPDGVLVDDPWPTIVPTSLVMIDDNAPPKL